MNPAAARKSLLLTLALLMTLPAAAQHPGWFSGNAGGVVSASGTWAGSEPNPTMLYSTRIECFQAQKMCVEADATNGMIELEYFEIVTWNKDEIIAHDSRICGDVMLRFDFTYKTVSSTLMPNGEPGYQGVCEKHFPPPRLLAGDPRDRIKKQAK